MPAWSFSIKTIEGIEMQIKVISEEEKTCEVYYRYSNWSGHEDPAISSETEGHVTIPETVTVYSRSQQVTYTVIRIGVGAFYGCNKITGVTIPSTIKSIGSGAFWGCSSLSCINIPKSVNVIENYVFFDCEAFEDVVIPNSVSKIGISVFSNCINLKKVKLPDSIKRIEDGMFAGCIRLDNYEVPKLVESIGDRAFEHCKGLKKILLPDSLIKIGNSTFQQCDSLKTLILPDFLREIGGSAFCECKNLESISIPNSVKTIGGDAFRGCSNLQNVSIGNALENIEYEMFMECRKLEEIKIPNSVKYIGYGAFRSSSIKTVHMGTSVDSIAKYAFRDCTVTKLHLYDIAAWCKVRFVDHPLDDAGLHHKKIRLYLGDEEITNLIIPTTVDSIGNFGAPFKHCNSLESVTIPANVRYIGSSAFYGCDGLESVHISDLSAWYDIDFASGTSNPTYYAKHLFLGKDEITDLIVPSTVTQIKKYAFTHCEGLKKVKIADGVEIIGRSAFENCTNMESVDMSNTILEIGPYAFTNHRMSSISIPSSVRAIGEYAFASYNCLKTVKSYIEEPFEINKNVFEDSYFDRTMFAHAALYVPTGSVDKYKQTYAWNEFWPISEIVEEKEPAEINEGENILWDEEQSFSDWNVFFTNNLSSKLFKGVKAGDIICFYIKIEDDNAEYGIYPVHDSSLVPDSDVDGIVSFRIKDEESASACEANGFTIYGRGFVLTKITLIRPSSDTKVITLQNDEYENAIYNLYGQKMSTFGKGIYIVRGKKYMIK